MTLEALEARRAERKDPLDLPHTMTQREVNAYVAVTAALDRRLMQARDAAATLAALPSPDADQTWLAHLNIWRMALCDELLALPPRIRDAHTLGVQQNVTLSLRAIDFGLGVIKDSGYDLTTLRLGQLMREAGYEQTAADPLRNYSGELPWFGSIKEVEHRIKEIERRRQQAQAQLDGALLDDDERERREAESKARIDALNALPQRRTRADGSQYDKFPDGRRIEVETTS